VAVFVGFVGRFAMWDHSSAPLTSRALRVGAPSAEGWYLYEESLLGPK
jgi:hypothetical protein